MEYSTKYIENYLFREDNYCQMSVGGMRNDVIDHHVISTRVVHGQKEIKE